MAAPSGIHIKASHVGKLHRALGIAQGRPIPHSVLMAHKNDKSPAMRKMVNFALNAKGFKH